MKPSAWWLAALCSLVLFGCSVDRGKNPAFCGDECPSDCVMGFCFADGTALRGDGDDMGADAGGVGDPGGDGDGDTVGDGDGDGDSGGGTGIMTGPCDEPGAGDFCYDGPAGTSTTGLCRPGEQVCAGGQWGACLGMVKPSDEVCNGLDDDCDGDKDEDLTLGSCETGLVGECNVGRISCDGGLGFCVGDNTPVGETCDGKDNDCDGEVDEQTDGACFPSGMDGCMELEMGEFACEGICAPGMQRCEDGELTACQEFVGPVTEQCNTGGTAADENCDGDVDEGCRCEDTDPDQDCYSGPAGTEGRGICKAGSQSCDGGTYGVCQGEVMPRPESCANEGTDDDCDGDEDDIQQRGNPCAVPVIIGGGDVCRDGTLQCDPNSESHALTCVPRMGTTEICNVADDDCDGEIDEDFELLTNPLNCGTCGNRCEQNEDCCQGECIDVRANRFNCGECGIICGEGRNCCNRSCVDTDTDVMNCGTCGRVCEPDQGSGGLVCCVEGKCTTGLAIECINDGL